ncbi:hypothetical protein C4580_00585 [Candidatus Woesearchaeota archaeon]|nr:MAG: hypothetical protein C4580_00585 [Candidatus Woesearchaeota archaeon]
MYVLKKIKSDLPKSCVASHFAGWASQSDCSFIVLEAYRSKTGKVFKRSSNSSQLLNSTLFNRRFLVCWMELDEVKNRLKEVKKFIFGPHAEEQRGARGGPLKEVIRHLTDPSSLRECSLQVGAYGDTIYRLVFELSDGLFIIPVIFRGEKLFIVTFIRRYRK